MHREYHKWYSDRLGRDMELLVFGHAGARVLVFPTRCGRFFDYENWGMVGAMRGHLENGWLQLYCVDSYDAESLYAQWMAPWDRIHRHQAFEDYIVHEVLPLSRQLNPQPFAISHGCSLGAYHAVNLAFRHPHLFGKVVAFSGRFDLTLNVGSFRDLFDGHYDEHVYHHMPSHYLPRMWDEALLSQIRQMEISIVTGADDAFRANNEQFSDALWHKGIQHTFRVWDEEAHRPRYWRRMIPFFF